MSVTGVSGRFSWKRLPVRAVVEGDVHAELGAGVEQAGAVGIFAHHARRLVGGDAVLAVGEQRPRLAVVVGAVDVRREIAEQEAIDGGVGGAGRCGLGSMFCTRPPGGRSFGVTLVQVLPSSRVT